MKLSNDDIRSLVKSQTINWVLATLFASGYALFAKLVWTGNFPILIFLPLMLMAFAVASINSIKKTLTPFVESDQT